MAEIPSAQNVYIRIFKFCIKIIILFILIKGTTYGWRLSMESSLLLNKTEKNMVLSLKKTVNALAGDIGNRNFETYANLNKAADFISHSFKEMGYQTQEMQYEYNQQTFRNVIAEKSGISNSDDVIIIGAHYDTYYNPGADDNASGIAGLIELARMIQQENIDTTVRFVAFSNEEPPFYHTADMGSFVYAKQLKQKNRPMRFRATTQYRLAKS